MNELTTFKISEAALRDRRLLLRDARLACFAVAVLSALASTDASGPGRYVLWALTVVLVAALLRFKGERWLDALKARELRIQDNALEIYQGKFTRLLFFNQIEQLRMIQGKDEKVRALELQTLEGGVRLSGYENIEALFAALSARRPEKVMVEVEEQGFDWHSIKNWRMITWGTGAILLLAALFYR